MSILAVIGLVIHVLITVFLVIVFGLGILGFLLDVIGGGGSGGGGGDSGGFGGGDAGGGGSSSDW
jgi:uncharacterized protein